MSTYSRVRANGFPNGAPYQPSTTCGPDTPRPSTKRPCERWSRVRACIAQAVGVRAEICTMDVPRRMVEVCAPHHASGPNASLPQDSAVNTVSNPRRSASRIRSRASVGGLAPQYPSVIPSFIRADPSSRTSPSTLERVLAAG